MDRTSPGNAGLMARPARTLVGSLAAGLLMLWLSLLVGPRLGQVVAPWQQRIFEVVMPDFRVLSYGVARIQGEARVAVAVTLARRTVIGGRVLEPNPLGRAEAMTPLAHTQQGAFLSLAAAAAWPAARWRLRLQRLAWALPGATLLLWVDAPLVLAASLQQILNDALQPGSSSWLVAVSAFLRGGGRFALGLVVAASAVALAAPRSTSIHSPPARPT
jgi:hypothetical protein